MPAAHCPDCHGHRSHYVRLSKTKGDKGQRRRVLACSACEREIPYPAKEQPGIACPQCGDVRLAVAFTRHRLKQIVRVRKCVACGHRIRTKEVVESWNG